MVEPCSYNTDQQKIIKTTFQSFLDCKNGIRIILLAGKYNGLNIKMWIIVGVKISHDKSGYYLKGIHMFQSAVTEDNVIILTKTVSDI